MRVTKHAVITVSALTLAAASITTATVITLTPREVVTVRVPVTEYVSVPDIPACAEEDSENCIWDAGTSGNGEGLSFVRWDGVTYYVEHEVEPEVVVKTVTKRVEVPVEVVREVSSVGVIDLHDGSGISYGWSRANAERKLTDLLGCDAKAPAAMDDWGNHVWFAYCEPALGED